MLRNVSYLVGGLGILVQIYSIYKDAACVGINIALFTKN